MLREAGRGVLLWPGSSFFLTPAQYSSRRERRDETRVKGHGGHMSPAPPPTLPLDLGAEWRLATSVCACARPLHGRPRPKHYFSAILSMALSGLKSLERLRGSRWRTRASDLHLCPERGHDSLEVAQLSTLRPEPRASRAPTFLLPGCPQGKGRVLFPGDPRPLLLLLLASFSHLSLS